MPSKTLKVDQISYDKLESLKSKNETFDDVLRDLLGLTPEVEDLAAYLPKRKREIALDIVEMIDDLANFEHSIETEGPRSDYHFISPESELTIVLARFEESTSGSSMSLRYRGMSGDMQFMTSISSDSDEDLEWRLNIEDEYDELAQKITEIVEGAVRKWYNTDS